MNRIGAKPAFNPVPSPTATMRVGDESDGRKKEASAGAPDSSVPEDAAGSPRRRDGTKRSLRDIGVELAKWAGAALAATVLLAILFFFPPSEYPFYPRCPLHTMTGLHCPGCGSLRALHSLLHGHIAAAFHFNALLILSLPFLACLGFNSFRSSLGKNLVSTGPRSVWIWIFFGAMIAFGVLRNLPFATFSHWAP